MMIILSKKLSYISRLLAFSKNRFHSNEISFNKTKFLDILLQSKEISLYKSEDVKIILDGFKYLNLVKGEADPTIIKTMKTLLKTTYLNAESLNSNLMTTPITTRDYNWNEISKKLTSCVDILNQYKNIFPDARSYFTSDIVALFNDANIIDNTFVNHVNASIENNIYNAEKDLCLKHIFSLVNTLLKLELKPAKFFSLFEKLLTPKIIFYNNSLTRFIITNFYVASNNSKLFSTKNFDDIYNTFSKNLPNLTNQISSVGEIVLILDTLTMNQEITQMQNKEIIYLLEENIKIFSSNDLLNILRFVCRSRLIQNHRVREILLTRINEVEFNTINPNSFKLILTYLSEILEYSKETGNILIGILVKNPDYLDNKSLSNILKGFNHINFPSHFMDFLNKTMTDLVKNKKITISLMGNFAFQMVKCKKLSLNLFKEIENQVISSPKINLTSKDIHYLLWSAIKLNYYTSPLFMKLKEPTIALLSEKKGIDSKTLSVLLWDFSQSFSAMRDFNFFISFVKKITQNPNYFLEESWPSIATQLYSISIVWARFILEDDQNYRKTYRAIIHEQMKSIASRFFDKLQKTGEKNFLIFKKETDSSYTKLLQFHLTLKLEFPELLRDDINYLNNSGTTPHDINQRIVLSELHIDFSSDLKKLGISFETEKKILMYSVDFFIEPNIVLEIEGVKHYARDGVKDLRTRDYLKIFHLSRLGYKIVLFPYYEYRKIFFSEWEKKKKYIFEKING